MRIYVKWYALELLRNIPFACAFEDNIYVKLFNIIVSKLLLKFHYFVVTRLNTDAI